MKKHYAFRWRVFVKYPYKIDETFRVPFLELHRVFTYLRHTGYTFWILPGVVDADDHNW